MIPKLGYPIPDKKPDEFGLNPVPRPQINVISYFSGSESKFIRQNCYTSSYKTLEIGLSGVFGVVESLLATDLFLSTDFFEQLSNENRNTLEFPISDAELPVASGLDNG